MYIKTTITSIVLALLIIGGALWYSNSGAPTKVDVPVNNVTVVEGKQIIDIGVRGGYQPRKSSAKAGIPTIIRFTTNGTYDCSIAVRLPSVSIAKNLPSTGTTDIDIGIPKAGVFRGLCSMGMYSFEINFTE